jgi:hypothetical protein
MKELARQIEATDALIVNLQEVHTYGLVTVLKKHLKSYPYMAFKPSVFGPKAGLITFSKLPIEMVSFASLFKATRKLDKSVMLSRAALDSLFKGVLIIRIKDSVTVLNVHLSANTDGDWSKANRFIRRIRLSLMSCLLLQNV